MSSRTRYVVDEEDDDDVDHHQHPDGQVGLRFRSPPRGFNPLQPLPPPGSGANVQLRSAHTIANINAARSHNRPEIPPSPAATGDSQRRRRRGAGEHRQSNPRGRRRAESPPRHATWPTERPTYQGDEDDEERMREQARRLGHQGRPYPQSVRGVGEGHAHSGGSSNGASAGSWNHQPRNVNSYGTEGLPTTYSHPSQQSSAPPPALSPSYPIDQRSMTNGPTSHWLSNLGPERPEDRRRRVGETVGRFDTALGRPESDIFDSDPWEGQAPPDESHPGHQQR